MAQEDPGISLRFKYGPQTFFLFVDRLAAFTQISEQLFDVLRESHPRGLTKSTSLPDTTPIPSKAEQASYRMAYALPKNPRDLAAGWRPLNADAKATPTSLKLRENTALAFLILPADDDAMEDESEFVVEIPTFEEDE